MPILTKATLFTAWLTAAVVGQGGQDALGGYYTIQQKINNRYLDAWEDSSHDFGAVTRTAQNNDSQKWLLTKVGNYYTIQQKVNNRYLDAREDSGHDFGAVTRTEQNDDSQLWLLTYVVVGQGGQEVTLGEHSKCKWSYRKMGCKVNCDGGWDHYKTTDKGCCRGFLDCFGNKKHCRKEYCSESNRGKIYKLNVPASGNLNLSSMPAGWNDKVSSLSWDNDCQVTLYEHPNYQGSQWIFGWGRKDGESWNEKTSSIKIACKNDCKWKPWGGWESCSHTCGSRGIQYRRRSTFPATHGGKPCSGSNQQSRACNRDIKCPIVKIECTDFEIPNEAQLPQYCTDVFVDILGTRTHRQSQGVGEMSFTQGTEEQIRRSTTSGFTNDFGWNFQNADREWNTVTDSTEILIKDPSVSLGVTAKNVGVDGQHSCFNQDSVDCTARNLGIGAGGISSFLPQPGSVGRRRAVLPVLGGLMNMMAERGSSGDDPDRCKCKEETTTVTHEEGHETTTTVGTIRNQGTSLDETFERSEKMHTSQTYTFECPPWSVCKYAQYSLTSICAIPYWGTCKATRSDAMENEGERCWNACGKKEGKCSWCGVSGLCCKKNSNDSRCKAVTKKPDTPDFAQGHALCVRPDTVETDTMTIERDDTRNLYYTKQSMLRKETYFGTEHLITDGSICGVKLVPIVKQHSLPYSNCPNPHEELDLPHCDCMLPEYQDCGTEDGTLKSQMCTMNARTGVADNEICLKSRPEFSNINNCDGRHVFMVSDINESVYGRLKAQIPRSKGNVELKGLGTARCANGGQYYENAESCRDAIVDVLASDDGPLASVFDVHTYKLEEVNHWGKVCGCSYQPETNTIQYNKFRHPCYCNGHCCPEGEPDCEYGIEAKFGEQHMAAQDVDGADKHAVCNV